MSAPKSVSKLRPKQSARSRTQPAARHSVKPPAKPPAKPDAPPVLRLRDPSIVLRAGKERSLLRRHPWVYASAIARTSSDLASGQTVRVLAEDGRFLAWAAFSPASAIRARCLSFDEATPPDEALFAARIQAAVARRAALASRTDAMRLVFGEADQLPGLIVDRYGAQLVVQFLSAGVEAWRETICAALLQSTGCTDLYERSDAAAREREGLPVREGVIAGATPGGVFPITEDGVRYGVDVVEGHKTGFYLDQRDNRALVARHARGRRVLNCFCYTGGFTLAARLGAAAQTLSIDSSAPALAQARANEALNGLAPSQWLNDNVFDALKSLAGQSQQFDLIVLDPPKFAPSAHHLDRASRAYKEINLKALGLLAPGGLLFTFSCSGAVSVDLFQKIVAGAVIDSGVEAQLIQRLAAGEDHPMLMTHPEGEYLKGLLLRRC
jgi:23S rRNA (cytosine1962-C5)-methyltransferase